MDYAKFVRFVNGSKKGDITPLLKDKKVFGSALRDLIKPFSNIDKVACLEARGFIFAGVAAYLLDAGVVMIRKGGNLPCEVLRKEFVDYSGQKKALEIPKDGIEKGEKVLIIDDWVETGAQSQAAASMIEQLGGIVVGFAVIVDEASEEAYQFLSRYQYHFLISRKGRRK